METTMRSVDLTKALLAALLAASLLSANSLPAPLASVTNGLSLEGEATLRWFGIHVYDCALFAVKPGYTTNGTAALCIRYAVSVKSRRLQETTLEEWQRIQIGSPEQRQRWLRELDALWPDVKAGERLTAFRRQGGATQFYFGDRLLGEVADPAFGPAFFAIWLDAGCRHPRVRDGLLSAGRTR